VFDPLSLPHRQQLHLAAASLPSGVQLSVGKGSSMAGEFLLIWVHLPEKIANCHYY
jgi:hypothetical protein